MRSLLLAAALMLVLPACAAVNSPLTGTLYTNVSVPIAATAAPKGSKHGSASASSILGILATGDSSIQVAASKAGIKTISHVDVETFSVLGLYATYTVHVYGE